MPRRQTNKTHIISSLQADLPFTLNSPRCRLQGIESEVSVTCSWLHGDMQRCQQQMCLSHLRVNSDVSTDVSLVSSIDSKTNLLLSVSALQAPVGLQSPLTAPPPPLLPLYNDLTKNSSGLEGALQGRNMTANGSENCAFKIKAQNNI